MDLCFAGAFTPGTARLLRSVPTCSSARVVVPSMVLRGGRGQSGGRIPGFGGMSGRANGKYGDDGTGGSGGNYSAGGGGGGSSPGGAAGSGGGGNVFTGIWAKYIENLEKYPILTKALTSLIGFFLGDLIAQKFLGEKDATLDKWRLARMASFGFLIHGPTGHYFYNALDRVIVGKSAVKVASKVFVDQVCWAPVFTALFFSYLGITERKTKDEIFAKLKNDTWTGVQASWKFWPVAHAVNFALIPTSQRLLYINTLQVGYNVILSILGNK